MKNLDETILTLENFEGPIALLLHLVHKQELDIFGIPLKEVTKQYLCNLTDLAMQDIDGGSEFISSTAALLLLKSKALLPRHETEECTQEEGDPRFEIIHYLLDYCKFKAIADELKQREALQEAYHLRGVSEPIEIAKTTGAGNLSLDELCTLFQQILSKARANTGIIQEELWKVSDKIQFLTQKLKKERSISFFAVFTAQMCRWELIVTFLALLELMKQGSLRISKQESGDIKLLDI